MNGILGFGLCLLGCLIAGSLIFAGALKVAAIAERIRWTRKQRDREWIRDQLLHALRDIHVPEDDTPWRR